MLVFKEPLFGFLLSQGDAGNYYKLPAFFCQVQHNNHRFLDRINGFVKGPRQTIIPVRGCLDRNGNLLYPDLVSVLEEFLMTASSWQFDTRHGANVAQQWELPLEDVKSIAILIGNEWWNARESRT